MSNKSLLLIDKCVEIYVYDNTRDELIFVHKLGVSCGLINQTIVIKKTFVLTIIVYYNSCDKESPNL